MMVSPSIEKIQQRKEFERLTAEFLANGGVITKCPTRLARSIRWLAPQKVFGDKGQDLIAEAAAIEAGFDPVEQVINAIEGPAEK